LGYTSLASTTSSGNTIFWILHLLVRRARWGSKEDKEKGENIEMYSTSMEKYDMRPTQEKAYMV
jgi:hypothetical protein